MSILHQIELQLLDRIKIKKKIESDIQLFSYYTNDTVNIPYTLKFELKNVKCSILCLKLFYYLEENKYLLNKKELSPTHQIKELILGDDNEPSFIKELIMHEVNAANIQKNFFTKNLIQSVLFNTKNMHINQVHIVNGDEDHMENKLTEFENSFEAKEKIQIILNFLKKYKITDKKEIQEVLFKILDMYRNKSHEPKNDFDYVIFEYFIKHLPFQTNKRMNESVIIENYKTMYTIFNYIKISI